MSKPSRTDQAIFCRARYLPEVELVSVAYRDRVFPEHSHEEVVIGAIIAGAETLTVRGQPHLASAGSVLRLHPGEVHANATFGPDELRYAVLYIPADTLLRYFGGDAPYSVRFDTPVIHDRGLHRLVCRTHAILAAPAAGKLAQESAMGDLAFRIGLCAADGETAAAIASAAVEQARHYIDDHPFDNFGLHDLSRLTAVSAFHLVRTFKRAFGLSPLAYRNQRRIAVARRRLIDGEATAQIALDLGYADQSHFTRHFQRIVGVSPQRYARGVRTAR
jgi:AraC-like DNA-binding protein